jgi:hypothetical protein
MPALVSSLAVLATSCNFIFISSKLVSSLKLSFLKISANEFFKVSRAEVSLAD